MSALRNVEVCRDGRTWKVERAGLTIDKANDLVVSLRLKGLNVRSMPVTA